MSKESSHGNPPRSLPSGSRRYDCPMHLEGHIEPPSSVSVGDGTARQVGQPVQELLLMRSLVNRAPALFPPGPGRSAFLMLEPDIGFGRPDAIVVTTSMAALNAFVASDLRIPTFSAARAFHEFETTSAGLSPNYARDLRRRLTQSGWTQQGFARAANVVVHSVAIEAKIRDWRQALRQVAKFHSAAHSSAILMPSHTAMRISNLSLDLYGTGVLSEDHGQISWRRRAITKDPGAAFKVWMLETLVRGLREGTAYRLSDSRKRANDALIASRRGR